MFGIDDAAVASLVGAGISGGVGLLNYGSSQQSAQNQMAIAMMNAQMQEALWKNQIQWKVKDSQAAGIHPLVGLGAQTGSFSPVSIGDTSSKLDLGDMGQDIGRAIKALGSDAEREKHDAEVGRKLQLEKQALENDVLKQEVVSRERRTSRVSGQVGPPVPAVDVPAGALAHLSRSPYRVSGIAAEDDPVKIKEVAGPSVKKAPLFGLIDMDTYPGRASAQDIENEYGEFAGDVLGPVNLGVDAWHTYLREGGRLEKYLPKWWQDWYYSRKAR